MRSNCICGNVKSCDISKENPVFNNCKDEVTPEWHDFEKVELTSYDNTTDSDEGSDEEDFIETFATTVIKKGNIAIIRADDHLYYLGILISEICKTEAAEKDNYQHEIPASQRVMKCNYLEVFRESKDGDI